MRLLLVDPFPPSRNPNPHLFRYVCSAASRILGSDNTRATRIDDSVTHLPKTDAALVFGSLAYAIREVRSLRKICKKMGLPLFYWTTDDPYEIDTNLENHHLFDWAWTNDKASLMFYDSEKIEHLPLAADFETHLLPFPREESYYSCDVSFVGVEFPNRRAVLEQLEPLLEALDTTVIGPNWTLEANFVKKTKISNKEAAEVSNRSRVVLNMGRSYDIANTRGIVASTPGPRTFEVGGCSTVQLVTWDMPEIEEYFVPDEEILLCDGIDEIKKEIGSVLADPTRRRMIAESAHERTRSCHLYDHRLRQIVQRIDSMLDHS